jgi:hypothetical protein
MANQNDSGNGMSGSELQESQATGDQHQPGRPAGGGATDADLDSAGGSSGTGGYGKAQNQENHQGQQGQASYGNSGDPQSRGERFDEMQGGGRGADSVSGGGEPDEEA